MDFSSFLFLFFAVILQVDGKEPMREQILDALERGLQFMEDNLNSINLDGVVGVRLVGEQLEAYLEFEPLVFREVRLKVKNLLEKADRIANTGVKLVHQNDPEYFSVVGGTMAKNRKLIWYPSRNTNSSEIVAPVTCDKSFWNGTASNNCFLEICGTEQNPNTCIMSPGCVDMMTGVRKTGYLLTHQVLYWQYAEMKKCLDQIPSQLRNYLCANVMRDAWRISGARYPRIHRDLFMEQIGLCGIWGFKDFYNLEWLANILDWQQQNGCFTGGMTWKCSDDIQPDPVVRIKRRERLLKDGCLSHKTTVGLMAIAVSLRFEEERIFSRKEHIS